MVEWGERWGLCFELNGNGKKKNCNPKEKKINQMIGTGQEDYSLADYDEYPKKKKETIIKNERWAKSKIEKH